MKQITVHDVLRLALLVILFCLIMQSWSDLLAFVGLVIAAIAPLVIGAAIAYIVAIPTRFLERHLLPSSTSPLIVGIRRPLCLLITVLAIVAGVVAMVFLLIPALIETITAVQKNVPLFIEGLIQTPVFAPVRDAIHNFLEGDLVRDFKNMDFSNIIKTFFGGTMGSVTTQVFTVVSTIMTGFFGMLFSFILLTDTSDAGNALMRALACYLGPTRMERLALVMGVADASFHNFIVRQFIEATILGSVAMAILLLVGYEYALGVAALVGMAALVPIVGYPIGLCVGALMVAISNVWAALLFVVCVAIAQVLEATFLLPHVGDPRTVLSPVWITVAVTIGGGVAGFAGMLVAIPVASTIRQLIAMDVQQRLRAAEQAEQAQRPARHMELPADEDDS